MPATCESTSEPTGFLAGSDPQRSAADKIASLRWFDVNTYVRACLESLQPYVPVKHLPEIVDRTERNLGAATDAIKLEREACVQAALREIDTLAEHSKDAVNNGEKMLSATTPAELIATWADVTKDSFEKTTARTKALAADWQRRQNAISDVLANRCVDAILEFKDDALASKQAS